MNKNDFTYKADRKIFVATITGMEISIREEQMTEEILSLTEKILSEYSQTITLISDYLSKDEGFVTFYGNISKEVIAKKLGEPNISVDKDGGVLSYCNHELDQDHIIDLEFGGALEKFYYVNIDG